MKHLSFLPTILRVITFPSVHIIYNSRHYTTGKLVYMRLRYLFKSLELYLELLLPSENLWRDKLRMFKYKLL
jgi:hypothetical protein